MNHVGRSLSQRTHTPRHTSPSVPLRDLTDTEVSEAVDTDAERREELLHASAVRFCPTCNTTVLTRRRCKTCLWCDGETKPATRSTTSPASPSHEREAA